MTPSRDSPVVSGVSLAIASAVAFGLTTPLVARLGQSVGILSTAALLYGGAAGVSLFRRVVGGRSGISLGRAAMPRLAIMALFGAGIAPVLFVWGLARTGSAAASLLLSFEAVFTVFFARLIYRESIGSRVGFAVVAMLVGSLLIAVDGARSGPPRLLALFAIAAATAAWAFDSTLGRGLAENDPSEVVAGKGAVGAALTGLLAYAWNEPPVSVPNVLGLLACGATGYGLSLQLYLLAQRRIGAARTGSVFAVGPFLGAGLAWLLGDRDAGSFTVAAALAFGVGVVLHLTEQHSHAHRHDAMQHDHAHRHDDGHHDHVHDPPVLGEHTHPHRHDALRHEHEHAPDIHHGHGHS